MHRKYRNEKERKHDARKARIRSSLRSVGRVRLTVFRSARHIYAQLDDPLSGKTIGRISTRSKQIRSGAAAAGNVEAAKQVGKAIAELAREKEIESVVFNRNGFLYHGRVKALAEAAREAGLRL